MKVERKQRKPKSNIVYKTKIESWMIPSVNMIVFTHSVYGEFIFDATKVKVNSSPNNQMVIRISPDSKKFRPGEDFEIKFRVDTKNTDDSSLHLLSVDEQVRYFGNDNDITKDKLRKIVAKYYQQKNLSHVTGYNDSRYNDLSDYNAFFITNAYVEKKDCSLSARMDEKIHRTEEDVDEIGTPMSKRVGIVRKEFPETFLFEDLPGNMLKEFEYTLTTKAPDSISSFNVNGFVFHPVHGVGIAEESKFTVIKDFFTKVFLPYSIRVHEVLKINVAAFNYLNKHVKAKITIEIPNQDENIDSSEQVSYKFVRLSLQGSTCAEEILNDKMQTKNVDIKPNSNNAAYFFIRADAHGFLKLKITATADGHTDIMIKSLTVEPHGRRKSYNEGFFVDLRDKSTISHSYNCDFPGNILNSTKKVTATSYGNILGQVLTGFESLIRMPSGEKLIKYYTFCNVYNSNLPNRMS